ncbi:MAG: hypothetical protein ACPL7J_00760, partial [Desulfomonilaceae bacterium]
YNSPGQRPGYAVIENHDSLLQNRTLCHFERSRTRTKREGATEKSWFWAKISRCARNDAE